MTPSDYLLDGIIRDLAEFDLLDDRVIDHATVLRKNKETVEIIIVTASNMDSVGQTKFFSFRDKTLKIEEGTRMVLERGEAVSLQLDLHTTESMLSKILNSERISTNEG